MAQRIKTNQPVMAKPNSVESIHSRIAHAYSERKIELGCSPKGIMFVFGIKGSSGVDIDVKQIYFTFKNHFRFIVLIEEDLTRDKLKEFIIAAATYKHSKYFKYSAFCNYIGFYFCGHGEIDENSRPVFMVVPPVPTDSATSASLQNDILHWFISNKEKKEMERYMFFFDCCLSYSNEGTNHSNREIKPFAFDTPPQCIVSFATSPGLPASCDPVNGGLWTSHFCEYLAKMDRGHTLTQVLDITNDVVMRSSEFKQPPQYRSCTGPIHLKGLYPLLYSFMKHKEKLVKKLQDDDITLVSLTALFHSKSIIDEATKTEIYKYKGQIGARILLQKVGKTCRASDVELTEMMVQIMYKQPELKQVIEEIYTERNRHIDPTSEELLENIEKLKTEIDKEKKKIRKIGK